MVIISLYRPIVFKFGGIWSKTPKITRVEFATFGTIGKNWFFPPNISESTEPILSKFSELIDLSGRGGW